MFMTLLFAVIPLTVAVPLVLWGVTYWLEEHPEQSEPPLDPLAS